MLRSIHSTRQIKSWCDTSVTLNRCALGIMNQYVLRCSALIAFACVVRPVFSSSTFTNCQVLCDDAGARGGNVTGQAGGIEWVCEVLFDVLSQVGGKWEAVCSTTRALVGLGDLGLPILYDVRVSVSINREFEFVMMVTRLSPHTFAVCVRRCEKGRQPPHRRSVRISHFTLFRTFVVHSHVTLPC